MTQMISPGKKRVDELFELLNSAIANYVNNVERALDSRRAISRVAWGIMVLISCNFSNCYDVAIVN